MGINEIYKQATRCVMTLPCMVSAKLNQKLSILEVIFFIWMHDENCPSILYQQMNVHMSLTQWFKVEQKNYP
jgi:hypothetical protein